MSDTLRGYAEKFLWVWGDQMRVRMASSTGRTPYVGNMDAGTYRPKDDPHAHAFVICQVEKCLDGLGSAHGDFAWHMYVNRHSADEFDNRRRYRDGLRGEIITALAEQIQARSYERMSERDAAEIMTQLRQLRRQGR